MRLFGVICCLALIMTLPARSSGEVTMDGTWWNGLSGEQQLTAVQAGLSAYDSGFASGLVTGMLHPTMGYRKVFDKYYPDFGKIFGYYQEAINDFYVRHPAASDVGFGLVMGCVADNPVQSCEDVAKTIH